MKKYIIYFIALVSIIVSSCKNDEITIGAPSTISVNASGVIAPFTYQYEWGELETLMSNHKLRIRSLVYNDRGELVSQESKMFDNYNVQLQSSVFLSPGTYTVIGISDVVEVSGNSVTFEYWSTSGEDKISELKVSDLGFIGLSAKVLGIAKNTLTVHESQSNSVNVNLQPAGALIYTFFYNCDALSSLNVSDYRLVSNKMTESVNFDSNGNYKIVEVNNGSTVFVLAGTDSEPGWDYSYNFILPMKNFQLWFQAIINNEAYGFETDEGAVVDVVAGDEYRCELSLNSNLKKITTSYVYANKTGTRAETWAENWNTRVEPRKGAIFAKKKMSKEMYNNLNTVLTVDDIR